MEGQSLTEILAQAIQSPWAKLLIGLASALVVLLRLSNAIQERSKRRLAVSLERKIAETSGVSAYTQTDILNASRGYVEPNCTSTDPSDEADLRNVVALAPLFQTIDKHLGLGGEKRHIILLADSGMGKTSFCINYYAHEQKKSKRGRVAIVPLGSPDPIGQINSIGNQADTVLFLDALDEDPRASDDPYGRLREVMSAASRFKNVVVTCRSQFFESDEQIPKGSGVMYATSRKAGVSREFPLHKLFLAPFNNEQIKKYISKHFRYTSWGNYRRRKLALKLVDDIPELSVRPMLLELVPDLIREHRFIGQLFGLYEYLVESWLKRERDWIAENELKEISTELAVVIYLRQRKGQGDRISSELLDEVLRRSNLKVASWRLKSRSLLNRDIDGNFKFAHRSVMEYLFLVSCLKGDDRCLSVEWTDLMKDLLVSLANTSPELEARTMELFQLDLSKTKLFPLASSLAFPRLLSISECKKVLRNEQVSSRRSRHIPLAWRNLRYKVQCVARAEGACGYIVNDTTHGLSWLINDLADSIDRDLYLDRFTEITQGEVPSGFNFGRRFTASYRHPSIEELIALWQSEPYLIARHSMRTVFELETIYWVGDKLENSYLCCSFGPHPLVRPELKLIDSRYDVTGRKLFLYELLGRYGLVNRSHYKAFSAYIVEDISETVIH